MSAQGHFTSDTSPPTNYSHALSWNVSFRFSISRLVPPHMLAKIHPNQGRSSRKYSKSIKEEPFTWMGGGLSLFHHVIRRLCPKQSPPLSYWSLSPGLYKLPSPDQLCVDNIGSGREGRSSQTEAIQKKIYQNRTFFRELEGGKLPLFGSHPQIIPTLLHGITPTAISGSVVWRVLESDVRIDWNQYWDRCWINLASLRSIVVFATSSNRTHHIEIVPTAISRSVLWRDLEFDVRRADGDRCWINLAP